MKRKKEQKKEIQKTPGLCVEEMLRFLPLPLCIANLQDKIIGTNNAFAHFTGYTENEIVGKNTDTLFVEKKKIVEIKEEVLKQKTIKKKEVPFVIKGQKEIAVALYASLQENIKGEPIGYFLMFSDISELRGLRAKLEEKVDKRTEEIRERTKELEDTRKALINMLEDVEEARLEAEEEKSKTDAIITNFVDGILVFNKDNVLTLINPQAENFFKIKKQRIIKNTLDDLRKLSALKPLLKLLHQGSKKDIKKVFRVELEVSENLILEVSTFPILRAKERLGTSVILHDISREKLIERMKTEFVSLAAHQLRTPLSAIKWTLKMLLDKDLGDITDEQEDFILKTYQSNERMINLINDLLNVARIEEGRYLYKRVIADLEEIITSLVGTYSDIVKNRKVSLKFIKPKEKIPKLQLDVEKIGSAVQNLIDNAIRYTPSGGKVTVSLKGGTKEVEVKVEDTGIGVPKSQQDRVFTKFFRAANVMRMETEGSGLGLFITKNIVEAHGGKISFSSKENKGTTFTFNLPIKRT
ncbi:ATP-binding protein [Patescibacteria group bacterium]